MASDGQAASFDCAKASTSHEKHLCADPGLSASDGRMGQSYRAALGSFPVRGFVRANQQRFLLSYGHCDISGGESCKKVIEERIAYLDSMRNSVVFSDGKPGTPFSPDDGVFWLTTDSGTPVIRYFGGYMPDMNVPVVSRAGERQSCNCRSGERGVNNKHFLMVPDEAAWLATLPESLRTRLLALE